MFIPFDDPVIWDGHGTIIDEIRNSGLHPDMVVLSVGGGGLLCGIIDGLRRNAMPDVPVLAVETMGAHSLWASLQAGRHLEIEDITSVATSLGAKKVAEAAFTLSRQHPVISRCVSDAQAIDACLKFAEDHRLLVEAGLRCISFHALQPVWRYCRKRKYSGCRMRRRRYKLKPTLSLATAPSRHSVKRDPASWLTREYLNG